MQAMQTNAHIVTRARLRYERHARAQEANGDNGADPRPEWR